MSGLVLPPLVEGEKETLAMRVQSFNLAQETFIGRKIRAFFRINGHTETVLSSDVSRGCPACAREIQ